MSAADPWRVLAERLLGPPELTADEVARQAGVDPTQARRLWQSLGFPPVGDDERVFTRTDVAELCAVRELLDVGQTDPDTLLQLTRVVGQSLARIVDAQLTATAARLTDLSSPEWLDPATLSALTGRIELLAPRLEQSLWYAWRRHLLAALRRLASQPPAAGHSVTVGFADLVGFTDLSHAIEPQALAAVVDRFEAIAFEHVPQLGGRIIKLIGDEVMFAADDPVVGAEIALTLAEAHAADSTVPDVHVGLAYGPVLPWEGDLFGPTVNLASRIVNLGRPGTALVSDTLGSLLHELPHFTLRHLRPLPLKGFGRVRVWVLRRAA